MNLEEKFKKHIEKLQNNHFTVAIPKLIHDLALIAEKYYVGEVLRPAMRADKLEKQLEGQEVIAEIKPTGKLLDLAARMDSINKEIFYHLDRGHKVRIILEVQE